MGGAARGDIPKRIWTRWFAVGSSSIGGVCPGSRSVNRDACLSIVAGVLSLCPFILCLRPSPWHRPASRAYFLPNSVCPHLQKYLLLCPRSVEHLLSPKMSFVPVVPSARQVFYPIQLVSSTYLSFRLQSQSCLIFCDVLFDSLEWD